MYVLSSVRASSQQSTIKRRAYERTEPNRSELILNRNRTPRPDSHKTELKHCHQPNGNKHDCNRL